MADKVVRVKFNARQTRTISGKRLNRYEVQLGCYDATFGGDDLAEKVQAKVEELLQRPRVALVKVGQDIRVILSHGGGTETYRLHDDAAEGVCTLTCTSYSGEDIRTAAEMMVSHLCKQQTTDYNSVPDCLPASQVDEYKSWCRLMRERLPANT